MLNTRKIIIQEERTVYESITCDKCKKTFEFGKDIFEIEEFHKINFVAGYSSVFGDMTKVECDICQHCLKELISDFARTENKDYNCDESDVVIDSNSPEKNNNLK